MPAQLEVPFGQFGTAEVDYMATLINSTGEVAILSAENSSLKNKVCKLSNVIRELATTSTP